MAKNGSFLLGAIVGGIAGAAATLFLSSERGKQLLQEFTETNIKRWQQHERENVAHDIEQRKEQEEQKPFSSIPIPLPSSDVEQLLKETEQAVNDVEKRLNKGIDAHGEN
ncbi:gas vesicle protein [Anoxybacillus mongoliensis]|uniref:Gas vesicle protein n=1 Tax=Anoxybacillus mongoliensis TaxID=452565 RepID=A0A7W8JDW0_9BACL|nr:YtxH domain-containing protein [Anoxybacillus mongoliensis]MBB5355132.1 gas vesicle protein [Anoxybacillus mongoliensis]MCX8001543.1 YtxH domain-containing protein [Anoxybacillus mongoliensis]